MSLSKRDKRFIKKELCNRLNASHSWDRMMFLGWVIPEAKWQARPVWIKVLESIKDRLLDLRIFAWLLKLVITRPDRRRYIRSMRRLWKYMWMRRV